MAPVYIQELNVIIEPLLREEGVVKAAIFGSFARGEQKANSDIDILVQLQTGKSLLDLIRLENKLKEKLGRDVDVITYGSIHPLLKDSILSSQIPIYG